MQSAFLEQSFHKAKKHIKNGDKQSALLIYKKVLDKFPKNVRALNALNSIDQLTVSNKQSSINEQNYIVQLYNNGQITEGITECERLIKIYPYDFYIFNFLGIFFHALKKYNQAEKFYKISTEINGNTSEIWSNFSVTQHSLGKYDEAIKSSEKALELRSDNSKALNNLGNAYFAKKEFNKALEVLKQSLLIQPNDFCALNNLGNTYQKLSVYDKALENLLKAEAINNKDPDLLYNIGCAYRDIGKFELSIDNYIKSVQLNKNDNKAFIALMEISFQLNLWKNYKNEFINFIQLNKDRSINYYFSIYNLINSFIENDSNQTEDELLKLQGYLKEDNFLRNTEDKDKIFIHAYFNLIKGMQNTRINYKGKLTKKINKIYHLGESHSLSFNSCIINDNQSSYVIEPTIIFGLKAWHLSQKNDNRFKSIFKEKIQRIPNHSKVLISIGEIDCRENEGIIDRHFKTDEKIEIIINNTINGYLELIQKYITEKNLDTYFISVPAPIINENSKHKKLRISVVNIFNNCLKKSIQKFNGNYLDTYSLTSNEEGTSNNKFMIDEIHLHPKIFELIKKDIL
tara:strand:- start:561 stop:2276 length:1716 start_codon:yes stop_codon:yes gene_type:complete